jgi:hypothetical protein
MPLGENLPGVKKGDPLLTDQKKRRGGEEVPNFRHLRMGEK